MQQAEQDEEDDQNSYDEKSENSFGIDSRRKKSDKDASRGISKNGRGGFPGYNNSNLTNSTFPNSNFPSLPLAGFVPVTTYRYSPYHQNILSQATPNVTAQATAKSKAGTVAQ